VYAYNHTHTHTPTQEAVAAKQQTDKYQLDKSHVFSVHMLDDIDKYARAPDTYTPPEPKPFKATVRPIVCTHQCCAHASTE